MKDERKLLLADYAIYLANTNQGQAREKTKHVAKFLETDCELTRKGLKEYEKEHAEAMIEGSCPSSVRNSINDFLVFLGVCRKKKRKRKSEEVPKVMEKLSVISERNMKSIKDFLIYLENERDYSPNTLASYKFSMKGYFKYANELTQDNARRYVRTLEEQGYKPETLCLRITALEKYGMFMHKTIKIRRPKQIRKLSTENIPTEKEYHILLEYLKAKNMRYYLWVRMLATTGARISEFLQFTFEDIMTGEMVLKGKGNKYRRFFFQKELIEEVKKYVAESGRTGYVAMTRLGTKNTGRGVAQIMKHWAKGTGIPKAKLHPHAFRHFFAKSFLKKTRDIAGLADLMGHENIDTTRIYLQKDLDEQRSDFKRTVTW